MKKGIVGIIIILIFTTSILVGCENKTLISEGNYTVGTIKIGEEYVSVEIKRWEDLEDGTVRILTSNGEIYKTAYTNVVMSNRK